MREFLASFDNREIAVAFWLLLAVFAAAISRNVRSSTVGIIRAFFVRSILCGLFLLAAYIGVWVAVLGWLGIWSPSQLKLTVLWFITAGCIGLFSIPKISETPDYFAQSAKSNFKITILLDFFVNLYRMPLTIELMFVPVAALLGALLAVSETKEDFAPARKALNGIAVIFGAILLCYAGWKAVSELQSVVRVDTLRSLVLPIVFSLLLLPFLWGVAIFSAYQKVFARLRFVVKDPSPHPYIKRSLLIKFRGNISYLNTWFRTSWSRTLATKSDVDESIQPILDGVSAV